MLKHLLGLLTATINAWKEFTSENGDIEYFSTELNGQSQHTQDSLRAISDIFMDLEGLQRELLFHKESCSARAEAVSHFHFLPFKLCRLASLSASAKCLLTISHTAPASNDPGKQESSTA
jgi:hypothetical protein